MPIMLNTILEEAGLELSTVSLVRHQDNRADRGRTPYDLWVSRADGRFDLYQSHQSTAARKRFGRSHWAVFVGTPGNDTLFVGLYAARLRGLLERDTPMPHRDGIDRAGSCDVYDLTLGEVLSDLAGKLFVDWGAGYRSWVQHADRQDKVVRELRREFREPDFPGFLEFMTFLSDLDSLPSGWIEVLRSSGGIYLLTCPRTREQYVGSATGGNGFWGRWQEYAKTGHGGDIALQSRDPSDYQVSILEVAGSAATHDEVVRVEQRWKAKLQSREMGLNRN